MRRVSVFGPLACLDVLSRLDVGLRCYGKTLLLTGFVGALGSDVCQHCQICYQTSPNQTRIGKRRIETILATA